MSKRSILGGLATVDVPKAPSLHRFRLCGAAKKRIEKLTDRAASVSGCWMRLDGKRVGLSHVWTADELDRAQVELAYGRLDRPHGGRRGWLLPHVAFVCFRASSQTIRDGWATVAVQVEQRERAEGERRVKLAARGVSRVKRLAGSEGRGRHAS